MKTILALALAAVCALAHYEYSILNIVPVIVFLCFALLLARTVNHE